MARPRKSLMPLFGNVRGAFFFWTQEEDAGTVLRILDIGNGFF